MASSKAQRRSFDVALKLKAVEFAVKKWQGGSSMWTQGRSENGVNTVNSSCYIFIMFVRLFTFQIQFFTNNRSPDGFINMMASHNTVFTQLLHVCVSCSLRVNSDLARACTRSIKNERLCSNKCPGVYTVKYGTRFSSLG